MLRMRAIIACIVFLCVYYHSCAAPIEFGAAASASDHFPCNKGSAVSLVSASPAEDGRSHSRQLLSKRRSTASVVSNIDTEFELPPCTGELRDPVHGCWLHDYVAWHKANRGKPGAKYLIWICYGPGGPGATRARTANVYGDNCAGLGDRMRGIQYLTRVAAGAKRVLLVYQESPAPMERFLHPALIDWRLTPEIGLDPEMDIVKLGKHYRISSTGRNRLRDDMSTGVFQNLTARVVTVSTNRPAHTDGSGLIPRMPHNSSVVGLLARALFRLSPEVEKATDDALLGLGIRPGQRYVAAHLRLGGLSGEQFLLGRFSHDPPTILAAAAACAANLTAAYGVQHDKAAAATAAATGATAGTTAAARAVAETAAVGAGLPHVLVTDNHHLRQHVAAGELRPWVTPDLQPAHFMMSRLPQPTDQPQEQPAGQRHGERQQQERSLGENKSLDEDAEGAEGGSIQHGGRRRLADGKHRRRRKPSGSGGAGGGGSAMEAGSRERSAGGAVALKKQGGLDAAAAAAAAAALEEVARLQVLNMADLGILMRAACVLISPSGFSIQAHLLSGQRCAMRLRDCPGAT